MLTELETLILGSYKVKIKDQKNRINKLLPEIANLKKLKVLDLTDNCIIDLPVEFSELKELRKLVLSSNKLQRLPEVILKLENLEELFVGNNNIKELPKDFSKLIKLHSLRLNNNKFTDIPEELELLKLKFLLLRGNPIRNVSKEIIEKDDASSDVKQWFLDKKSGESFIYEAKLILVGAAAAGKTTLSNKIRNPNFILNPTQEMTRGIEVEKWGFSYNDTQNFVANIWDFGGQDIMHSTHRYFLTERSLYLLVVDIRAEDTDYFYWLNIIELLGLIAL
jgi:internalin A